MRVRLGQVEGDAAHVPPTSATAAATFSGDWPVQDDLAALRRVVADELQADRPRAADDDDRSVISTSSLLLEIVRARSVPAGIQR